MSKSFEEVTSRALSVRKRYAELERRKYGSEWNGEELMLGFGGDYGWLGRLVMAKEGRRSFGGGDIDEALANELADCLWSVIVIADRYGVDLEGEFMRAMDELEGRIEGELEE